MAHGVVMEEWERDSEKSPGPASSGRVMGSRRIFAPQFKLQVLDSYRQDADCKGNQRATARKYGIHRRQIQKWLQMESHLRSLTGGSGGAPSSPGGGSGGSGGSTVSLSSPVPSPSPGLLHHAALAAASALNLSCEARLLGGLMRPVSSVSAIGAGGASPSPSGSGLGSPGGSPAGSPAGSPLHAASPPPRGSPLPLPLAASLQASLQAYSLAGCSEAHQVSDEEDDEDEIDVDGTESEASSALDYTTATLSKRRSFSLQFKLEVLDAFKEDPHCQGNQRATARLFGINRRQVQKWLGQETELREEAVSRGGHNRQRLGRWLDQDESDAGTGCLDLSRKRKHEPATSDLDDAETEAKRSRVRPIAPEATTAAARTSTTLADVDAFRPHPGLPHPLLFRPQPVNLPLMPPLPLPLSLAPLPFNLCAKQYSVDLKLSTLDYFNAHHQQNLQKWLKPEDFLKHSSSASFLLNSFR
ncbi:hypothetical protein ONE63_004063 [Megalurothrips usitatus]|uniref:Brinker DNA-binding domain-containing protein n=1 Tax=Megalurothrips usitatus TaxID=439358 RepID=A0AAV7X509_9NEOP|nr:hypothetical protein ONE63_004063 [Megalurothrips usitatus]